MSMEIEIIDLKVISERVEPAKGISEYIVDTNMIPDEFKMAMIFAEETNEDRLILNQFIHNPADLVNLSVRTRLQKIPAKKYDKGDVVAKLVVFK